MTMTSNGLSRSVRKLLHPLVRLLLRHGVAFADFSDWAKRIYVEVAEKEFGLEGRKQSVSRIAVLTGINRKDVKKLLGQPISADDHQVRHNRAVRVIRGWLQDQDFIDDSGEPKHLSISDSSFGFPELVKRYSGDMPARAVLDELLRVGVVRQLDEDNVELAQKAYIPHHSDADMLLLAGDSVNDLLETVDYNLTVPPQHSRLQLSVAYDNLPGESVEIFRHLSREQSMELLRSLDRFLSTQDRDANPNSEGSGRYRAGLGVYYFEQKIDQIDQGESEHENVEK